MSNKDVSLYMGERTAYQQIRDYARCLGRPWSWRNVANDLGLAKRKILYAMADLKKAGEIVRIGNPKQGMYLHTSRMPKYGAKLEYDWTPDKSKLQAILKDWEPGTYRDAAACAAACGLAERTGYRYLELLVFVGAVEWCLVPHIEGSYRRTELSLPETLPAYSEAAGCIKRRKDAEARV